MLNDIFNIIHQFVFSIHFRIIAFIVLIFGVIWYIYFLYSLFMFYFEIEWKDKLDFCSDVEEYEAIQNYIIIKELEERSKRFVEAVSRKVATILKEESK